MMVRVTQPLEGDKSAATVPSQGRFFAVKFYRPDTGTWQRFVVDAFFLADVSKQPRSLVEFASLPHSPHPPPPPCCDHPLHRSKAGRCFLTHRTTPIQSYGSAPRPHPHRHASVPVTPSLPSCTNRMLVLEKAYAKFCHSKLGYQVRGLHLA